MSDTIRELFEYELMRQTQCNYADIVAARQGDSYEGSWGLAWKMWLSAHDEQQQMAQEQAGLYSVEPHGDGWAIYHGRDMQHHGLNLGQLTECRAHRAKHIERALNALEQPTPGSKQPQPIAGEAAPCGEIKAMGDLHFEQDEKHPRSILVAFKTEADCRNAVIAGVCRYTDYGENDHG